MINNYTKKFATTNKNTDSIQCALEFNQYLINQLNINKDKLNGLEYEYCLNVLWENLKKLSKNADNFLKTNKLSNSKKHCEQYKLLNKKKKLNTGLTIVIDKSILKDNILNN